MPSWFKLLLFGLFLSSIPTWLRVTTAGRAVQSFAKQAAAEIRFIASSFTATTPDDSMSNDASTGRTPVYFLGHGGPNIKEQVMHPAHHILKRLGKEITTKVKPKAVVALSAHWQGFQDTIEVNTAESMGLIYDFYGFPAHYYEWKYPNTGDPALAEKIIGLLRNAGIKAEGVRRGLDHGVWASYSVAFDPETNPLNVPIVQVSLFDEENPDLHYALGKALSSLRDEGVLIITSGMAVHNLREYGQWAGKQGAADYATTFDDALKEAAETPPDSRQQAMADLLKREDAKKAHPTFEHLLPVHVAAGAASEERGKQIWTLPEGSMSWAQYRFGEVGK
ncbi:unnamed protein product [Zymoseptoria tritici ST99CH_3D1]|nr:unnamed protein product [Zymoseptoria tritici ST99CH_3D1]